MMAFPAETSAARICVPAITHPSIDVGQRPLGALATCFDVATEAVRHGVDPVVAVALSYRESRFDGNRVSSVNAVGPLQVIPRYWCPSRSAKSCNLTRAGIRALKAYRTRHRRWLKALCHYNAGNVCGDRGRRYASHVMSTANRIRAML